MSAAEPSGAGAGARVPLRAARALAWIVLAVAIAVLVVQATLVPGWSRWSSGRFSEADAAYGRSTLDYVRGRTTTLPRHCCEPISTSEREHLRELRRLLSWWFDPWPALAAAIAVLALVLLPRSASQGVSRSAARSALPDVGRRARRAVGPAVAIAVAALGAVVFALVVFPRLFTAFHAVVLPDALRRVPTGSVTARVVPQSFFERYALWASLIWSVAFVVCWQAIRLLIRLRDPRRARPAEVSVES